MPIPASIQPIVDKVLWDEVQAILAENRVDRATGADAKQPSLLAGLIFDESGERLTPSHAVKKGTRYRYYVSRSLIVGTAKDKSTGRRIPAANLETLVITKLRSFLADEGAVLNVIREEHVDGAAQSRLIGRGVTIAKEIESLTPDRVRAMLMTLISRVDIRPDCVEISVRRSRLVELLGSSSIELATQRGTPDNEAKDILTLTVRARLQRVGREMKMLVENTDDQTEADPALLRIVARAHDIQERLMQNSELTLHAIASQEHVTARLRLSPPAPSFVGARHHHCDRQRQKSASTHRQEVDATGAGNTGRLDRTAEAAWLSRTISAPLRVRRTFDRRASRLPERFHHPHQTES